MIKFINKVKQVLYTEKDNVPSNRNGEIINQIEDIENEIIPDQQKISKELVPFIKFIDFSIVVIS